MPYVLGGIGELLTLIIDINTCFARRLSTPPPDCLPRNAGSRISCASAFSRVEARVSMTLTMLIDTHTHLDDARYDGDRMAMITRARETGVEAFVTIGCDLATSQAAVALAEQYPFVYASIGVHPHEVKHILR